MKTKSILIIFLLLSAFVYGQDKTITLTLKISIITATSESSSEIIAVDENNNVTITALPSVLAETSSHEKIVQDAINKIVQKGFKLLDSSSFQYGGIGKYWIVTRYTFISNTK